MKNNPLTDRNISLTHNVKANYQCKTDEKELLSRFYDHIAEYYDIIEMESFKNFMIESFYER
jgi:hypothetical protein